MSTRRWWVSDKEPLTVAKQCVLASVNRSTVYLPSIVLLPDAEELLLLELIDKEYTDIHFMAAVKSCTICVTRVTRSTGNGFSGL